LPGFAYLRNGYVYGRFFRNNIGQGILDLSAPELNAFQHLAGYSAMYFGGLSISNLQKNMNRHEWGETGTDVEVDLRNNELVINKYIPAIRALNKTFYDPYAYSIEIIKLMQTIGYNVAGTGPNAQPIMQYMPQNTADNLIRILGSIIQSLELIRH
jgi:hypothetical protein